MTSICSFGLVDGTGKVQGAGGPSGSSLEDVFVGTAAHYIHDTSFSLQYLLSPRYLVGALGAEPADFINCSKQDAESHPGRAAASCLSVLHTMGRQSHRLVTLSGPKVWPWKLMEI